MRELARLTWAVQNRSKVLILNLCICAPIYSCTSEYLTLPLSWSILSTNFTCQYSYMIRKEDQNHCAEHMNSFCC
jgi:hypothetical protein